MRHTARQTVPAEGNQIWEGSDSLTIRSLTDDQRDRLATGLRLTLVPSHKQKTDWIATMLSSVKEGSVVAMNASTSGEPLGNTISDSFLRLGADLRKCIMY